MQIIADTIDFKILQNTAVAIGKFDGMHKGHRILFEKILEGKKRGLKAVIFTFDPPPEVLFGKRDNKVITTREEKRILFRKMGIDILIEYPLNKETAAILPRDFVAQVLKEKMNMSYLVAGSDITFGHRGEGNAALLKEMCKEYDFTLELIEKIREKGREISSTFVREEIQAGRMEEVTKLLGVPYEIAGEVVHGAKLGRRIGMPTINLLPCKEKLLPPKGVYYSKTLIGSREYKSITNIGKKPTVNQEDIIGAETYIYEFDQDVYGRSAVVKLLGFRRPEMKFDSVESLKEQMMKDIQAGREWDGYTKNN